MKKNNETDGVAKMFGIVVLSNRASGYTDKSGAVQGNFRFSNIIRFTVIMSLATPCIAICGLLKYLVVLAKETKLERADFTLQLLMFVTAGKERRMFIIFFLSSFYQLLSTLFSARAG